MRVQDFPKLKYDLSAGPVEIGELPNKFQKANCRLAIQLYYHIFHGISLQPEKVLCPSSYKKLGVKIQTQNDFFDSLIKGDLIFAERILNKKGQMIDKGRASFKSYDEYIINLHSAIYVGSKIWHCTAITGESSLWTKKHFLKYYKPIIAKRLLSN